MYHSMTRGENKDVVLSALTSTDPAMRLVIATSSLGCGVNAVGIKYVVHFGPSYDVVDYCQQIGRGRDTNEQCYAILYTYSEGHSKISNGMKSYMKGSTTQCLRSLLYSPFNKNSFFWK